MKKYLIIALFVAVISSVVFAEPVGFPYADKSTQETNADSLETAAARLITILAESIIIEDHFHNYERVISKNEVQTATVIADTTEGKFYPYVLTSAADSTFGTAIQILGSDDTPIRTGMTKFDFHKGFVTDVDDNTPYLLRILCGATASAALVAGDYTDLWISGDATNPQISSPIEFPILIKRFDAGTNVWAQIANAAGAQTMSLLFALHEYPE